MTMKEVHPHACGERSAPISRAWQPYGSSPRMWGTLPREYPNGNTVRFIPTHVGNVLWPKLPPRRLSVHPHACGERSPTIWGGTNNSGSSPRMWGTSVIPCQVKSQFRFIPTHVGNVNKFGGIADAVSVHPHACGERCKAMRHISPRHGSSPRMWGTCVQSTRKVSRGRFIPTHVGNVSS